MKQRKPSQNHQNTNNSFLLHFSSISFINDFKDSFVRTQGHSPINVPNLVV